MPPDAPAATRGPGRRRRVGALAALVLLAVAFLGLGVVQARDDSPTFDEPVYVAAGLLALREHDLAFNAEHPPLAKALAALPVIATGAVLPPGHVAGSNDERDYSARFLQAQRDAGILDSVALASRLVPLLEGLAVAAVLLLLGRSLLGLRAGITAAALWLLSPLVLGLAHLDGVDLPFALAVVVHSAALLRARRRGDRSSLVLLGVALGLTLATSAVGLVLVPVTAVLLVVQRRGPGVRQAITVVVLAWLTLWASYAVLDPSVLASPSWLLPTSYVDGLRYLSDSATTPAPSYLLGVAWTGSQWWFVPGSLLVKLTTPVLVVLLVGPFLWRLAPRGPRRDALVVLAVPALALTAAFVGSQRDIGVRYALPVVALWCVGASPVVLALERIGVRVVLGAGAVAAVVALLVSAPHSLAYTSPPFTPGYRVATDSNVDWGQDLGLLKAWGAQHPAYVDWFGPRGTSYADVPGARDLMSADLASLTGWVAVSATHLTSDQAQALSWLRAYCPVGDLGGTVLLYRFDAPPSLAPGPVAPALPCDGGVSRRTG
jgi:hypothetical protein